MLKKYLLWSGYGFLLALLTYLSLSPIEATSLGKIPYFDKAAHTGFYLLLQGSFGLAYGALLKNRTGYRKALWRSALVHVIYGIVIEVIQETLVQGRFGEWQDGLANTLGVCLGSWLCFYLFERFILENEKN